MDTTSHASAPREVSRQQLDWLRAEVADWRASGVIDATQAERITGRYDVRGGSSASSVLGRIMLLLGGAFVGVGLIWLVASNLDELSPMTRFIAVVALWLAFLIGGEVLAARRAPLPLVGAIRLLAALGIGAVIMQAAQSLQVPAYEPTLVGLWSLGALLHAHLTKSTMPFLVGLGTGVQWWIWQPLWTEGSAMAGVISLGAGAVVTASLAVLSDGWVRSFAWGWRLVAAALALAALFVAAIPGIYDGLDWSLWLIVELIAAVLLGIVAVALAVRRPDHAWIEPVGAFVVLAAAVLLALWDTGTDISDVGPSQWAHAVLSVVAYVGLAVALLALDVLREHRALNWVAMAALVAFTTFQSFAVFAPIVTGALLFVVLGVVFLGTGLLFDRARRRMAKTLDPVTGPGSDEGVQR
ncbi:DUF2157 domain-containing protein [Janibacter cremeus]|uniref:DUF2157 domain-containing protein n=1 Tax=Janibacter cremeus TaxID=1285192 RepID=UPI0023F61905|nr:DUF2157 domain-containing protein [Janibacter cremeus]WEV78233.1 DUF2157 domain-containing protein [Janibacter cremeus]WEV78313.1 DUF2157 domain-containing protein [Janibacter cremeus]